MASFTKRNTRNSRNYHSKNCFGATLKTEKARRCRMHLNDKIEIRPHERFDWPSPAIGRQSPECKSSRASVGRICRSPPVSSVWTIHVLIILLNLFPPRFIGRLQIRRSGQIKDNYQIIIYIVAIILLRWFRDGLAMASRWRPMISVDLRFSAL